MKTLALILIILIVMLFGSFVVTKFNIFIKKNHRLIYMENRHNKTHIHIAAESRTLLNSVLAHTNLSSHTFIEFVLSSGKAEHLLQKIIEGRLDIVILTEKNIHLLNEPLKKTKIPCRDIGVTFKAIDLMNDRNEDKCAFTVWNKCKKSKDRDRVLFAIEAEAFSSNNGYVDYLD